MIIEKVKYGDNKRIFGVDTIKGRARLEALGINVDELEVTETARLKASRDRKRAKMNADYKGTVVSITEMDALAMLQVQGAFALGVAETNIKFENGATLHITSADFEEFAVWFVTERNKLFI